MDLVSQYNKHEGRVPWLVDVQEKAVKVFWISQSEKDVYIMSAKITSLLSYDF